MVTPAQDPRLLRVRIVRDRQGKVIGFQDPDKGAVFISRQSAIPRLRYSIERSRVEDSFGNEVGVGALGLPARGVEVAFKVKEASYKPLGVKPEGYQPRPNEEIIERVIVVNREGKLIPIDTSYGLGKKYDPSKTGGRWRQQVSETIGVKPGERLPTKDLKRAIVSREIIIKAIAG